MSEPLGRHRSPAGLPAAYGAAGMIMPGARFSLINRPLTRKDAAQQGSGIWAGVRGFPGAVIGMLDPAGLLNLWVAATPSSGPRRVRPLNHLHLTLKKPCEFFSGLPDAKAIGLAAAALVIRRAPRGRTLVFGILEAPGGGVGWTTTGW